MSRMQTTPSSVSLTALTQTTPEFQYAPTQQTATSADSAERRPHRKNELRIIARLDPDVIEVTDEIPVIVKAVGLGFDNFIASFSLANINASGETQEVAMRNLREVLSDRFLHYCDNESKLGREPRRQLAMMRQYLKRL